jgi:orotate phosphoribosyltransferase
MRGTDVFIVRKEAKEHGTQAAIEGKVLRYNVA